MTMRLWPARCRKCRQRQTFALEPREQYCSCGGLYVVDQYRKKLEHRKNACYCDGYEWSISNGPHRKGSPKCVHNSVSDPDAYPGDNVDPVANADWANSYPF